MHQGPTTKILICLALALGGNAYAQLNTSDEVIETIDDIKIEDDSAKVKKETNKNKPNFDEEFGKKAPVVEEKAVEQEEIVSEPESSPQEPRIEEEAIERKALDEEKRESYENELEKNARRNRFERKEVSPEDMKNFEVDPAEQQRLEKQAKPEKSTPIESPQEPALEETPTEEPFVATPTEEAPQEQQLAPRDEIEQEISDIKAEEEEEEPRASKDMKPTEITPEEPAGPTIYYPPEESGPVISYENEKKLTDEQIESLSEKTKVEIEDDPYVEGTNTKKVGDYLKPYRERRPSWTFEIGVGANQYIPMNYLSEIMTDAGVDYFETFYEDSDIPSPEISFEFKKNFSWAAIGLGFEGSYYSTSNEVADFTLIMPSVKLTLYLDTLFDEPYIVPYGSVGYTYMMHEEIETATDESISGETDNVFVSAGVQFQLDWLDPIADALAFEDSGIQNTFVYVEGRTYLDQGVMRAEEDGDFSSDTHIAGGIKIEF